MVKKEFIPHLCKCCKCSLWGHYDAQNNRYQNYTYHKGYWCIDCFQKSKMDRKEKKKMNDCNSIEDPFYNQRVKRYLRNKQIFGKGSPFMQVCGDGQ